MKQMQKNNVVVMRSAVRRQEDVLEVREATTGRVVVSSPRLVVVPRPARLERVWAVAEPIHDDGTVMDGAPGTGAPGSGAPAPAVELAFYRKYTEALLRRYMRMSMSAGRVPSIMGREMFRGHVTHYRAHTFEDVTIFCLDIERQIARLTPVEKELVKRVALQQYSQMEAAAMLGLSLRHSFRRYFGALDRLTELFLVAKLLEPLEAVKGSGERARA